ncbi:MAG TPA: adenylosuccinate synthetase [Clostridia bacterium]|nr:adenylosuccinate synthetase [Clostridia bacterium]
MAGKRKNSFAFCGGAFGDEGKGRVVDKFVEDFSQSKAVVVYRDNGGANAGHTLELKNGHRIALHQLPSGVFAKKATVVLGKGMVLHPGDLKSEIEEVETVLGAKIKAKILIDEMAALSLDTHRAFEAVLKTWHDGGKGATGRGIAPAYADILLRHPLRMRDLLVFDKKKIEDHYLLYEALIAGLGQKLETVLVPTLAGEKIVVGTKKEFVTRLEKQKEKLIPYISEVYQFLQKSWRDEKYAFVFEKAQGVGLDWRYGVYPDVTASDTTLRAIFPSTEGIIDPQEIEVRAGVIKATYMSTVGTRKLPTMMEEELASRIREDAQEYGATTRRPRGIAYLDLAALKFFSQAGFFNCLVLTHMDIVYPNAPIKICTGYELNGKEVSYRPDQEFLNQLTPKYIELPSWDKQALGKAKKRQDLPSQAKDFLDFISQEMNLPILMITSGPKREQGILFKKKC